MTSTTTLDIPEPLQLYPIRPPAEPLQNRAVGVIKGRYIPSTDSEVQGLLLADDGALIDAVVLGKVKGLLKKIDPSSSHAWVVYPKTNTNPLRTYAGLRRLTPASSGITGIRVWAQPSPSPGNEE
jgi:hypothetical protein